MVLEQCSETHLDILEDSIVVLLESWIFYGSGKLFGASFRNSRVLNWRERVKNQAISVTIEGVVKSVHS
jgi:hypothetical protein